MRNFLFDKRLINIKSFEIPVISVGNLTAGGTGKTPFIIYLIESLGRYFKKPAVVTRGYGRKTRGCVIVSDGLGNHTSALAGGDEALLIAWRHPQTVVIASERRAEGIKKAIDNFDCDIIFLDDGFQHRYVKRDCDIVLVNAREGEQGTKLLPQGRLREPLRNINRADLVVITKGNPDQIKIAEQMLRKTFSGYLYHAEFRGDKFIRPDFKTLIPGENIYGKKIAAFCGIAHPEEFRSELNRYDLDICAFLSYPDHRNYDERDVYDIIKAAKGAACDTIVTTEKDLVRLNANLFSGFELLALRLTVSVSVAFNENIRTFIDKTVSY